MAAANHQLFVFDNGRKIKDSKLLEVLVKAVGVSANGNDNGLTISEASGKFDFNGKVLGNIASGTAAGQALSFSQVGAASGVCGLDSNSKVPANNLPNSIMEYMGVWNATTNSPTLADGTGNADTDIGNVYRVGTGGTQDLGSGSQTFSVGDYVILNSSKIWERADTADIGTTDDLPEGSVNLYFSGKTSDQLSEGTSNLYFASGFAAATTDGLTEGTTNLYFSGKNTDQLSEGTTNKYFASGFAAATTDGLTEGTTNLYFSGKNTDQLSEGTTNKYFASGFAAATTDGLTEGTTNLYFSGKTTDDLPEGTVNKYFTGVPNYAAFVNKEISSAITVGQFVKMTTAGQVTLLTSTDSVNDESFFGCVKDASIAVDGTGNVYLPEVGARVGGYTGLDVTKLVYAHGTTAGSYTQTRPTSGKVIILGKPISATEIIFLGRFEAEYV